MAFRFDVFISYRHEDPDAGWAAWLQEALETYRVPARLVREKKIRPRVGRVFLDTEELSASPDLSQSIADALNDSDAVIVVCSPRTPHSRWINEEVRRFVVDRKRSHRVFLLLIEGEPANSFPIIFARCGVVTGEVEANTGSLPLAEPLAADARVGGGQALRERRHVAKLRLVSAVLGCKFDDLRQRERQRRNSQTRLAIGVTLLLAGLLGAFMWDSARRNQVERDQTAAAALAGAAAAAIEHDPTQAALLLGSVPGVIEPSGGLAIAHRIATEPLARSLIEGTEQITAAAFSADGRQVVTGASDGSLRIWRSDGTGRPFVIQGSGARVSHIAFSPDGARIVTADAAGFVRVRHADGSKEPVRYRSGKFVNSLEFSRDGRRVLIAADRSVSVWAFEENKTAHIDGSRSTGVSAMFDREGARIFVASDGHFALFRADGSERLVSMPHAERSVHATLSPDGRRVAVAFATDVVRVWTLGVAQPPMEVPGSYPVAFSPDGRWFAAANENNTASVWPVHGRTSPVILQGHSSRVMNLEFSRDGTRVLTGSADGSARLWALPINRASDRALDPGVKSDSRCSAQGARRSRSEGTSTKLPVSTSPPMADRW